MPFKKIKTLAKGSFKGPLAIGLYGGAGQENNRKEQKEVEVVVAAELAKSLGWQIGDRIGIAEGEGIDSNLIQATKDPAGIKLSKRNEAGSCYFRIPCHRFTEMKFVQRTVSLHDAENYQRFGGTLTIDLSDLLESENGL